MAIYYLSPTGLAVPPYDTWEKAANNLSQILNLGLTGENTIYVAEGTYSGSSNYIKLTNTKYSNLSIIGVGSAVNTIFDPGNSDCCYINHTPTWPENITFRNITLKTNEGYNAVDITNGSNIVFDHCDIMGDETSCGHLVYEKNNSDATFNYCRFWVDNYCTSASPRIFVTADSAQLTLNYCIAYSPNGAPKQVLWHDSDADVTVNNSILSKSKTYTIWHGGAGNLTINNSIIGPAAWMKHNYDSIGRYSGAGACNVNNSVILPSTFYPEVFVDTGVTTTNVIESDPRFGVGIKGFIVPRVDDAPNADYALSLANILEEYGYKGSFFVEEHLAGNVIDTIRTILQTGAIEIGGHTHSHQGLTYDHALYFEYSGSDSNPTVELDSARVIHLRTDGSDDVDIDTTQSNADTLGEIIDNFSGTNNWTISYSTTDGQSTNRFRAACKAESLAEMSATAAPCDIDFLKETGCTDGNCRGLYKVEIYDPRIGLTNLVNQEGDIIDPQTGQTYETRTFVPPFGVGDDNVVEALRTSGYIGASGFDDHLDEILPYNVFKTGLIHTTELIVDGDEEQTTQNAYLFAINVAINGLSVTLLGHKAEEATMEEWRWILNGFKRAQEAGYNIQVTSLQLAIEALKRLGTYDPSTGDVDIHWSMPSFRLRHDSPCIDAGKKLPIHDENWRDLAGNKIRYGTAPDIGCYEKKTWPLGAWGMLPWIGGRHKVQWTPYEE